MRTTSNKIHSIHKFVLHKFVYYSFFKNFADVSRL